MSRLSGVITQPADLKGILGIRGLMALIAFVFLLLMYIAFDFYQKSQELQD